MAPRKPAAPKQGLRPNKAEISAVAGLLGSPADNADELAARIIETLDLTRSERGGFVVVAEFKTADGYGFECVGPYPTRLQGEKALAVLADVYGKSNVRWAKWRHRVRDEGTLL